VYKSLKIFRKKPKLLFVNSIPKAGTHLVISILHELGIPSTGRTVNAHAGERWLLDYDDFIDTQGVLIDQEGVIFADTTGGSFSEFNDASEIIKQLCSFQCNKAFSAGHLFYSDKLASMIGEYSTGCLIVLRKPSDIVSACGRAVGVFSHGFDVSLAKKFLISFIFGAKPWSMPGVSIGHVPLDRTFKNMIQWVEKTNATPIFYEDITPTISGGRYSEAALLIRNVLESNGHAFPHNLCHDAIVNAFGKGPTYSGVPQTHFSDIHKLFNLPAMPYSIEKDKENNLITLLENEPQYEQLRKLDAIYEDFKKNGKLH